MEGEPPSGLPPYGESLWFSCTSQGPRTFGQKEGRGDRTPSSSLRAQGNFDATFVVSTVGGPSPQPSPRGTLRQAQGERIRCCDVGWAHPPGGTAALAPPARPRPGRYFWIVGAHPPKRLAALERGGTPLWTPPRGRGAGPSPQPSPPGRGGGPFDRLRVSGGPSTGSG